MIGKTIGSYKVTERIGHGGMGIVYRARHVTIDQIVAIKALTSEWARQPEMRERFINEAKSQAILNHPNIVNLYSFFEQDGLSYLVMEYVDGDTVERVIKKIGLIPPERCIRICKQILSGLAYAHSKGIIHRDIKPSNMIATVDGIAKITDFGIAKIATDFHKTQTGIKIGTLPYMSPEYLKGDALTHLTDIYALGITLYQMVSGKLPFTGDSEYQLMKAIVEYEPPSPVDLYPHIPGYLEKAILKAIRKDPAERFQSAMEFSTALEEPTSISKESKRIAPPDTDRQKTVAVKIKPATSRSKWGLFITGGIFLVLIIVGIVYFIFGDRTRPPTSTDVTPMGTPAATAGVPVDESKGTTVVNTAIDVVKENKINDLETVILQQKPTKSDIEKSKGTTSQRKKTNAMQPLASPPETGRSVLPDYQKKPTESETLSSQPKGTEVMQPLLPPSGSGRSVTSGDQKESVESTVSSTVDVKVQTRQTTNIQGEANLSKPEQAPLSGGEEQRVEKKGAPGWIIKK